MDLTTVREVIDVRRGAVWRPGDAWLAGGTHLFAEPQPHLTRLWDLGAVGWEPLTVTDDGLEIAATCTIAELLTFASASGGPWPRARRLVAQCCRAFSSSFKVWNTATVGGNMCLALPAAPMISLAVALEGVCLVHTVDGRQRRVAADRFVTGAGRTDLRPGEMLRAVAVPAPALHARNAMRRVCLRPLGRSAALVIATLAPATGHFTITVTAATQQPVRVPFTHLPSAGRLRQAMNDAVPPGIVVEDVHGLPAWRRHLTQHLAEEVRRELAAGE